MFLVGSRVALRFERSREHGPTAELFVVAAIALLLEHSANLSCGHNREPQSLGSRRVLLVSSRVAFLLEQRPETFQTPTRVKRQNAQIRVVTTISISLNQERKFNAKKALT